MTEEEKDRARVAAGVLQFVALCCISVGLTAVYGWHGFIVAATLWFIATAIELSGVK